MCVVSTEVLATRGKERSTSISGRKDRRLEISDFPTCSRLGGIDGEDDFVDTGVYNTSQDFLPPVRICNSIRSIEKHRRLSKSIHRSSIRMCQNKWSQIAFS